MARFSFAPRLLRLTTDGELFLTMRTGLCLSIWPGGVPDRLTVGEYCTRHPILESDALSYERTETGVTVGEYRENGTLANKYILSEPGLYKMCCVLRHGLKFYPHPYRFAKKPGDTEVKALLRKADIHMGQQVVFSFSDVPGSISGDYIVDPSDSSSPKWYIKLRWVPGMGIQCIEKIWVSLTDEDTGSREALIDAVAELQFGRGADCQFFRAWYEDQLGAATAWVAQNYRLRLDEQRPDILWASDTRQGEDAQEIRVSLFDVDEFHPLASLVWRWGSQVIRNRLENDERRQALIDYGCALSSLPANALHYSFEWVQRHCQPELIFRGQETMIGFTYADRRAHLRESGPERSFVACPPLKKILEHIPLDSFYQGLLCRIGPSDQRRVGVYPNPSCRLDSATAYQGSNYLKWFEPDNNGGTERLWGSTSSLLLGFCIYSRQSFSFSGQQPSGEEDLFILAFLEGGNPGFCVQLEDHSWQPFFFLGEHQSAEFIVVLSEKRGSQLFIGSIRVERRSLNDASFSPGTPPSLSFVNESEYPGELEIVNS